MDAEDFFNRWAKRKTDSPAMPIAPADVALPTESRLPEKNTSPAPIAPVRRLPTLDDVQQLTHDSDYSPFIARGVDEAVKRSAMKKLFSDPRFNIMDGLDTYIGDYHTFDPIPPDMLAALHHAKTLLDPLSVFDQPLSQVVDRAVESDRASEEGTAQHARDGHGATNAVPEDGNRIPSSTVPQKSALSIANTEKNIDAKERPDALPVSDINRLDSV